MFAWWQARGIGEITRKWRLQRFYPCQFVVVRMDKKGGETSMISAYSNKRITKNTIILYFRTILLMLITLYTSRVTLQVLGEVDFGIYNIVGGVIVLFAFINSAMSASTQRFLNFELGRRDEARLSKVFNLSLSIHFVIAVIVVILGEIIGFWFLNNKINIPDGRMSAARIVYQISLASCAINILRVPFNACIIAYEKMSFYGIISLAEGVLKLLVVFMLLNFGRDKLIFYSILMLGVSIFMTIIYVLYCNRKFIITHFRFVWDKMLARQLLSFSTWSLLGSASIVAINQGVGVIFNIFVGVVVNAVIGIANQVNAALYSFVSNFQTAFIPQIVKTYAGGYKKEFYLMLNNTARYSFLLLFVVSYPIFVECDLILNIWLVEVPDLTVQFTRLIILSNLFDALSGPLWSAVQATGKIRNYQITVSLLFLSSLPLSYVGLKLGISVTQVFAVKVLISAIVLFYRLIYLRNNLGLSLRLFLRDVIFKAVLILAFSSLIVLVINGLSNYNYVNLVLYFIVAVLLVLFFGLNKNERNRLSGFVSQHLKKQS